MLPGQKGALAEAAVVHAAVKLGISVFKPVHDGERYDLIFDLQPTLVRVQCKWAVVRDGAIIVRCYSERRGRSGNVRRLYSSDEIDAFAAYCAPVDRCFFIPIEEVGGRSAVQLRLHPARNNQRRGIHWANDFDFPAKLHPRISGAIAQLGERLAGSQKGTGSSPVGSIADRSTESLDGASMDSLAPRRLAS
jgi:hypothetical protein